MKIGILTNTYHAPRAWPQPTLEGVLDAIAAHGLHHVQFDLAAAGLASLPDDISDDATERIRIAMASRHIEMAAASGTFNMAHPDPQHRADGLRRLNVLAAACARLNTSVITLCTGTRALENMWQHHPDNRTSEAWGDLLATMREAAHIAEAHNITLALEPEVNNVVDSARKARQLLDDIRSTHLKVVMDGANVFHTGELPRMRDILTEAFDLLGDDIALAHAKDLDHDGDAGHLPAGYGLLDYGLYLSLLSKSSYTGPLILHGLTENQVPGCVAFLREMERR
ncbi:MAG: sugar phosphate isomerase/epimerase [Anaerolineae bacterium]|nr:sugar phosphate isomerase/epimerase [Anaerolineae bacterium]